MNAAVPSPVLVRTAPWWRLRPVLVVAFVLSLVVHAAFSLLADELPDEPEPVRLSATIRELPPPPAPAAKAAPAAPRPKPARPAPPAPTVTAEVPPLPAEPEGPGPASPESAPAAPEAVPAELPVIGPPEAPVLAEAPAAAPVAEPKVLPPRVDLAYKVFYGAGLFVGTVTYRFEHADQRYVISTVGEARGLAALFVRGRGRVESRGIITPQGLQPLTLEVDKFNKRGSERAQFDWENGLVTLHEDKVVPLEGPTFDPLVLMWQFYFQPPQQAEQSFALATTRRVNRVTVRRERTETIAWGDGTLVDTEVWHRTSDDGKTEQQVWLAPGLRWIPVKIRAEHATRGTVEAVLDAIRVDEPSGGSAADSAPAASVEAR